jgi:hypothetical protein
MRSAAQAPAKPEEAPEMYLDVYFSESAADPKDDVKAHADAMAWAKPYLERVIKLAPDSDEAKRAKQALANWP